MPSVRVTWKSKHDNRVCSICQAIDGYAWTFTGSVPDSLVDPVYGEVWNVTQGSLVHEKQDNKARALTHETAEKFREIADMIDMIICYSEPKVYLSPRVLNENSNLAEILL